MNFSVAAGCGGVYHGGDSLKLEPDARPFRRAGQNHKGDFSSGKVLLIAYSPVGREQNINRRLFCRVEQRAVAEPVPSFGLRGNDGVAGKRTR